MNKSTATKILAWSLSALVCLIAVVAWGQGLHWQWARVDAYRLFPLLGLIAFSLMWSHYCISALRQWLGVAKSELAVYIEVTSLVVLVALALHPGLIIWKLWRAGLGLPPGSVINNYVAPGLGWAVLLGTVSWFVFLAYEGRRWFAARRWWPIIEVAGDLAIVAIYFHALKLGALLQHGWLRDVWICYGLLLAVALGYLYWQKFKPIHSNLERNPK